MCPNCPNIISTGSIVSILTGSGTGSILSIPTEAEQIALVRTKTKLKLPKIVWNERQEDLNLMLNRQLRCKRH